MMAEVKFATELPHCEFFLTGENVGFLMLSASGEIYRKWQGLTAGEMSIFADVDWHLSHSEEENFSRSGESKTWLSATRTSDSVTRNWRLACGCLVSQEWRWPSAAQHLEINHCWNASHACRGKKSLLTLTPLWTLCPHGSSHAGGTSALIIDSADDPAILSIRPQNISNSIELRALQLKNQSGGRWVPLDVPSQLELSTPHDALRGENHSRSVIKTVCCEVVMKPGQTAGISVNFVGWPTLQKSESETKVPSPHDRASHFEADVEHEEWARAFANSQVSLNQLVRLRSDGTLGLQAGLPWFTQFWTRDLCHSFRAAFLWSGRFSEGERLICDLWQRSSATIPNYTTSTATTNNSADALPLLLLTTADLVDILGMTALLREQLDKITMQMRAGAQIFLQGELVRHGPADTWMDAQKESPTGNLIACSPRADRAFEIQAFWLAALMRWSGLLMSVRASDDAKYFAKAVHHGIKTVRHAFYCKEKLRWADHLRSDNTQELSLRPNIFLGFSALQRAGLLQKIISDQEMQKLLDDAIDGDLIVSYGVRTLSPDTSIRHPLSINQIFSEESAYIHENKIHFHPYHEFGSRQGLEHPDWAYHNGTIWPWLSHSVAQFLLLDKHKELAIGLLKTLVWHSNHGTQGGAISELLDGLSSHSPWSWPKGAPHQAWSEAALIHIICEELLGLRVENSGRCLRVNYLHWPMFPEFSFSFSIFTSQIIISKKQSECTFTMTDASSESTQVEIHVSQSWSSTAASQVLILTPNKPARLKITHS